MIKYTKLSEPFKTKKLASKFITAVRTSNGNKFDRIQIKNSGESYFICYYTFPKELKTKINAIVNKSKHTSKMYEYYEVAAKPLSWIDATYKRLMKMSL
jgi:hypothetical protein